MSIFSAVTDAATTATTVTQPQSTSGFNWNNLIATAGGVVTSIFGKQPTTTVTSSTGTTSSVGTGNVVIGANGSSVIPSVTSITSKTWFWPVVIIVIVVVLFGKTIMKIFRR